MANKKNTSPNSVDPNQPNFLNFQPKTQREQDLYNLVNGRLQEFAAVDPEYAGVMENSKASAEYTLPNAAKPEKQQEVVPQEPVISKQELEEKIHTEVKTEVQKEVQREVQKVVSQEVQKEVQKIVPQEVEKAVQKVAPVQVQKPAEEDFDEPNTEKLFIEDNEPETAGASRFNENDSDDDTADNAKRIILIIVFIGLLAAVIFIALRSCSNTPESEAVVADTTMQQPQPVQEDEKPAVEPETKKASTSEYKIDELKGSSTKPAKMVKKETVSVQQPAKTVATQPKATQSKVSQPKAAQPKTAVAKVEAPAKSTPAEVKKVADNVPTIDGTPKVAEPAKVEESKTTEPVKVEEPAKVEEPKAVEPAKVAEPTKPAEPAKVAAPEKPAPAPVVAKDLPFQEKNSKQAAPAPAKKPAATTKPATKPVAKPAQPKVPTTKPTTDDLKELEKQKESGPRICTPDKVPSQGYVISYSTTKNESTAIKTVMIVTRTKHLPCGYYWLGDSKTQKKSTMFRVFVGPYKTEAEAQAALATVQQVAPDAKVYTEMPTTK